MSNHKQILISGASGFLGRALESALQQEGYQTYRLFRGDRAGSAPFSWEPEKGIVKLSNSIQLDGVIHLAGDNIASGRWTAAKKERIRNSRVAATALLVSALGRLTNPPKTFLCASAVGIYGDRGAETLTEESPAGTGFLAEVTKAWEQEALRAESFGARCCLLRFGVILDKEGGALGKMLLPFKLGLGGVLGSGKQYMSWISRADAIKAIQLLLEKQTASGPYNLTSPSPCTNRDFTKALGRALHRPTLFTVPEFALKTILGEMAEATLLSSARVIPNHLLELGFSFSDPNLSEFLSLTLREKVD